MCVPLELNPRPFALLTQCSTTVVELSHCNNVFGVSRSHRWYVSRCCTCKVYVGSRGAFSILYTFFSITEHHPAAVLPRISSRGWRQNQLTVPLMLLDAGTTQSIKSRPGLCLLILYHTTCIISAVYNIYIYIYYGLYESFYKFRVCFMSTDDKYIFSDNFLQKDHILSIKESIFIQFRNHFSLLEIAMKSLKWHFFAVSTFEVSWLTKTKIL